MVLIAEVQSELDLVEEANFLSWVLETGTVLELVLQVSEHG